jgi:SAM-dependent methyltransferase
VIIGNYDNPQNYWEQRAKTFGVSAPGFAGGRADDNPNFKTLEQIGQFDTLIDFGCGTGRNYPLLSQHCRRYIGLDFSSEMLKLFNENHKLRKDDTLLRHDLTKPVEAFRMGDALVTNVVLQHIVDETQLRSAVANIKQLLIPGGTLYVHECMDPTLTPKYAHIALRSVDYYKQLFAPEITLETKPSYLPLHTLLVGQSKPSPAAT